jgi:chromosome segregation ATPase
MAKRAKEVAKDTLAALDKLQALQREKAEEDKALEATTNKVMELSTKLQAANLARDLAMQAATTANADTDNQHLQNKQLSFQLSRVQEQVTSLSAERDSLSAKLGAVSPAQPQAGAPVPAAIEAPVQSKPAAAKPALTGERNALRAEAESKQHYIDYLRERNADQAKQLEALRAELANLKRGANPTVSVGSE